MSGTVASSAGKPTGMTTSTFSLTGLPKSLRIVGPAFSGVLVKLTKPAF